MKKRKPQNNQHSFYKEAKKSFAGENQFSRDKAVKLTKKYSKWGLYGFLIVSTLWGCVNQFRNPTSQNVTQGIEFYKSVDDTWSNLYQGEETLVYSNYDTNYGAASGEKIFYGVNDYQVWKDDENTSAGTELNKHYKGHAGFGTKEGNQIIGGLQPLNFNAINPNLQYGNFKPAKKEMAKEGFGPDVNITDTYISVADITDKNGLSTPKTYAYQASLQDIYGFVSEIVLLNWETIDFSTDTVAVGGPTTGVRQLLATNMGWESNGKIKDEHEEIYSEMLSWSRVLDVAEDNGHWSPINIPSDFWLKDEDGKDKLDSKEYRIMDTSKYSISFVKQATGDLDWNHLKVVERIAISTTGISKLSETEKAANIANQLRFSMNMYAFNTATTLNQTNNITFTDKNNVEYTKTFLQLYNEAATAEGIDLSKPENQFSYTANLPSPLTDTDVDAQAQLYLMAQSKGNPISPTEDTLKDMEQLRKEAVKDITNNTSSNWSSLSTNGGTGRDNRTDNVGWAIMDSEGTLKTVKDGAGNEVNLWGLQNELNNGTITYDYANDNLKANNIQYNSNNRNTGIDLVKNYVLDEKINSLIGNTTTTVESGFQVGYGSNANNYNFKTTNDFGGVTNLTEVGFFTTQSNYVAPYNQRGGQAQAMHWEKEGEKYIVETSSNWYDSTAPPLVPATRIIESSKINSAISSTGQSGTNSTRTIFAGWSDWGRAWGANFGPMHGVFVFPLAMVSLNVIDWMPYHSGWGAWGVLIGMFLIVFAFRGLGTLMSWKSADAQAKMQEVQTDVAQIKARYANYDLKTNKKMKQKQQQEIMALYKKKEVNPFQSFGTLFLTMPIFLSMFTLISSITTYKIASIGLFSFSVSPFYGMFNIGSMFILYLLVGILVGLAQGISSKLPSWLGDKRKGITSVDEATKAARKKANKTQNIMVGVFIFIGLTVQTLLAFYWIISALFTIALELGRHFYKEHKAKKIKEG